MMEFQFLASAVARLSPCTREELVHTKLLRIQYLAAARAQIFLGISVPMTAWICSFSTGKLGGSQRLKGAPSNLYNEHVSFVILTYIYLSVSLSLYIYHIYRVLKNIIFLVPE